MGALSGRYLHLVCGNVTNGSVIWSNNLAAEFGATTISWENGASPRLDGSGDLDAGKKTASGNSPADR